MLGTFTIVYKNLEKIQIARVNLVYFYIRLFGGLDRL